MNGFNTDITDHGLVNIVVPEQDIIEGSCVCFYVYNSVGREISKEITFEQFLALESLTRDYLDG